MPLVSGFTSAIVKSGSPISGSTGWSSIGLPSLDLYGRTRAPSPVDLIRECLGTAYACTSLNAELVSSTPGKLYVRTTKRASQRKSYCIESGRTRKVKRRTLDRLSVKAGVGDKVRGAEQVEEVTDHPLLDLLNNPNPDPDDAIGQSQYTLWEVTQRYLETVGRAYWWVPRDGPGRTPSAIWCLPAYLVTEIPSTGGQDTRPIDYYSYSGGGKNRYEVDEVVRFSMADLMSAGYVGGFSPLRAAFEQVRIFRQYEAHTNALLENGGMPNAIWSPKGDTEGSSIGKEEAARMKLAFRAAFAQAKRGGVFVSEYPGSLEPLTWPTNEIVDAEAYKLAKNGIANCFSVPTTKLDRADSTLASAKTGDYAHARDAGIPRLRRLEATLNNLFIPLWDKTDQLFWAFDEPEGLHDDVAEAEATKTAYAGGAIKLNEFREKLGFEPMEGDTGETRYIAGTLVALGPDGKRLGDEFQPTRKPEPKAGVAGSGAGEPKTDASRGTEDDDEGDLGFAGSDGGGKSKSLSPGWAVKDARATLSRQLALAPEDDPRPLTGKAFDPSEPRDEDGKWTRGGAATSGDKGGRGRFVVRGGNHVFEHEQHSGPETRGHRFREGDRTAAVHDFGDVKKGDKVEVVSVQDGKNSMTVKVDGKGKETEVHQGFLSPIPGRSKGDDIHAAPNERPQSEVDAAVKEHGEAPSFKPLETESPAGQAEHDFTSADLDKVYVVDPAKAKELVDSGAAESVADSAHDENLAVVKATGDDHEPIHDAGGDLLANDQQGMQSLFEATSGQSYMIAVRPGGKQITARQVNGDLYTTYDKATKEYGLTTAGELEALRDRFSAEYPDEIHRLKERQAKKRGESQEAA